MLPRTLLMKGLAKSREDAFAVDCGKPTAEHTFAGACRNLAGPVRPGFVRAVETGQKEMTNPTAIAARLESHPPGASCRQCSAAPNTPCQVAETLLNPCFASKKRPEGSSAVDKPLDMHRIGCAKTTPLSTSRFFSNICAGWIQSLSSQFALA
ncbi:hypothetical protein LK540_06475 [Massilia sp. IC2-278]|uniref:hypothetical protein n=1 Tax=Massilia sp. IC2-278 TaxID=2887200 RepID=UPI001E643E56|nr:hypothetical protein [Massilia sp. IC2-278]MCC2960072.1 hypothetical protein [Massilia sp. IC2-278]